MMKPIVFWKHFLVSYIGLATATAMLPLTALRIMIIFAEDCNQIETRDQVDCHMHRDKNKG
jgi:hypothetical protein